MAILTSMTGTGSTVVEKSRRGIQSVEIASRLLQALARHIKPMALKDVAQAAGMSAIFFILIIALIQ